MSISIEDNSIILFQGDSVTDCGRKYEVYNDLGPGYPMMIAAAFTALYPEKNITFLNRGISGNRVIDLENRWKEDCINIKPSIITILIGINDTWRRYDSNDPTSTIQFEATYRNILTQAKKDTTAKLILMEPFLLPVSLGQESWREDLDPKIQVVRKLAREFNASLIPLDGIFAQASTKAACTTWTEDGVHPTQSGHALITKVWLDHITK
jgi:acyl-CoA thioesterase I